MLTYRTYFKLDYPVLNIDEANHYLTEDDMTKYIKDDSRIEESTRNKIEKIEWRMTDEQSGHITLTSTDTLTDLELNSISNWVSGQNADGLANYQDEEYDCDEDEYGYDCDNWVMASFDWKTNDYKFELISSN